MIKGSEVAFVLSPHHDDAELGCGGTIAKLLDAGTKVKVLVFTKDDKRREEQTEAARILKGTQCYLFQFPIRGLDTKRQAVLNKLLEMREQYKPDLILQPALMDIHQDHQVVSQEGLRAFKNTTILGYETLWNNFHFDAQHFVKLDESHLDRKVAAIKSFKSQSHKAYADEEFTRGLAKVRGVQGGCGIAEVFSVIRSFS